jgi:hypothetical protein
MASDNFTPEPPHFSGAADLTLLEEHPSDASACSPQFGRFPLEEEVTHVLGQKPSSPWKRTGTTRVLYLDMAETIVRTFAPLQDSSGAITDPVTGEEWGQATPRFACPGAYLLSQGRIPELRSTVERAMTSACERLAAGEAPSPDFWMRELATAYRSFQMSDTSPALLESWAMALRRVDPEKHYLQVRPDGSNLHELHNWTVYAAAGEVIREVVGLVGPDSPSVSGFAFFDKYMPAQLTHFTEYGMYRDPKDPFTYDLTTRLQISAALRAGYTGPLLGTLQELLRRGALTQLFYLSPLGMVPYGGRSSQFHFQEAIVCALCEAEAKYYAANNSALAGAFKRQAHLTAKAMRPWILETNPFRYARNRFPIEENWGGDQYAHYSCYGLTAASFLTQAANYADDSIVERPCPAEIGGFVLHLDEAFHKVFATGAGYHVEIDTRADFHHDATGLGRVHRTGVPFLLGMHAPFTSTPKYHLPKDYWPHANASFSSYWKVPGALYRLAEMSESLTHHVQIDSCHPSAIDFTVHYQWQDFQLAEAYSMSERGLRLTTSVSGGDSTLETLGLQIPVLITDGGSTTEILDSGEDEGGLVRWRWAGEESILRFDPASVSVHWQESSFANRNGIYRLLLLETTADTLSVELSLGSDHTKLL